MVRARSCSGNGALAGAVIECEDQMPGSNDGAGLTIFVGARGRELTAEHRAQVDAAVPAADVRHFEGRADLEREIEQADVVVGSISAEGLARAKRLKWVQSWAAGTNEILFPEMVESPVVVTSCAGNGGIPLAEHAIMLMLMLGRNA